MDRANTKSTVMTAGLPIATGLRTFEWQPHTTGNRRRWSMVCQRRSIAAEYGKNPEKQGEDRTADGRAQKEEGSLGLLDHCLRLRTMSAGPLHEVPARVPTMAASYSSYLPPVDGTRGEAHGQKRGRYRDWQPPLHKNYLLLPASPLSQVEHSQIFQTAFSSPKTQHFLRIHSSSVLALNWFRRGNWAKQPSSPASSQPETSSVPAPRAGKLVKALENDEDDQMLAGQPDGRKRKAEGGNERSKHGFKLEYNSSKVVSAISRMYDESVSQRPDGAHFLDLSRSIQNVIYNFVLVKEEPYHVCAHGKTEATAVVSWEIVEHNKFVKNQHTDAGGLSRIEAPGLLKSASRFESLLSESSTWAMRLSSPSPASMPSPSSLSGSAWNLMVAKVGRIPSFLLETLPGQDSSSHYKPSATSCRNVLSAIPLLPTHTFSSLRILSRSHHNCRPRTIMTAIGTEGWQAAGAHAEDRTQVQDFVEKSDGLISPIACSGSLDYMAYTREEEAAQYTSISVSEPHAYILQDDMAFEFLTYINGTRADYFWCNAATVAAK
ncbi:hypothetical protein CERZMDRAFT_103354 [Cercospora zeae-maydis SCOH1-5]|uniref:Uncharacterized protein n=1 Tax=Cercospora zeae-maydis SCOH1-5 TaxID=717836 RepID=A0A6A6F1P6_9PEZI|nr:hypothetical protein CERZMDRAFT_103354 [Cercospora zeae-maydis SCOH1-5]